MEKRLDFSRINFETLKQDFIYYKKMLRKVRHNTMAIALKSQTITKGFIIAGLMNLSVLVFSRFFTNSVIPESDPNVMSNFGLLIIVVWGLAYISVAKNYQHVKWLVGVFAIEKIIYGIIWIKWMLSNNVSNIFSKDKMAGIFYSIYGINDLLFFIFFSLVFLRLIKIEAKK